MDDFVEEERTQPQWLYDLERECRGVAEGVAAHSLEHEYERFRLASLLAMRDYEDEAGKQEIERWVGAKN